jgi:hypothetical protein
VLDSRVVGFGEDRCRGFVRAATHIFTWPERVRLVTWLWLWAGIGNVVRPRGDTRGQVPPRAVDPFDPWLGGDPEELRARGICRPVGAPVGCHLSATAVSSEDGMRHAAVMVVHTLALLIVRRVLGLVGLGPATVA